MDIRNIDRRILVICILAVLSAAAAVLIYVDPSGKITGRPDRVSGINVYAKDFDSVSLRWKASDRAGKYVVYRSDSKNLGYEKVATVKTNEYTDKGLITGNEYWYKVRAANDTRRAGNSKKISGEPELKTPEITARSTGDGVLVKITPSPGADGYVVYRDDEAIAKGDGLEYLDTKTKAMDSNHYSAISYREVEDEIVKSQKSRARAASKAALNISVKEYEDVPELIKGDDEFVIKGKIESNATIDKVKVGVMDKNNEWVSTDTRYEKSGVNEKTFDIQSIDENIAMENLPVGQYKFTIVAEMKDGTVKTIKDQEFTVREPKGGELIVQAAIDCAWPYGTPLSKYKYSGGSPTPAYKDALNQAYGSRSSWSAQTRAGASCDVFVGTVVRVSGVDPGFPRGLDGVVSHYKKNTDLWEEVGHDPEDLMPGDVIFQLFKGGGGHISVYIGDGLIAQAHYKAHNGTYGIISDYSKYVKGEGGCNQYHIYRSKK